jgi:hypothetical protein
MGTACCFWVRGCVGAAVGACSNPSAAIIALHSPRRASSVGAGAVTRRMLRRRCVRGAIMGCVPIDGTWSCAR